MIQGSLHSDTHRFHKDYSQALHIALSRGRFWNLLREDTTLHLERYIVQFEVNEIRDIFKSGNALIRSSPPECYSNNFLKTVCMSKEDYAEINDHFF